MTVVPEALEAKAAMEVREAKEGPGVKVERAVKEVPEALEAKAAMVVREVPEVKAAMVAL